MIIIDKNEAKEQGLSRYFTGSPCSKGHISERYVSGRSCVECVIETRKKKYLENTEKSKEQSRNWYLENLELHKTRSKFWQKNNPEKVKLINKTWVINNRDIANARTNRRRSNKLQRTPSWANPKKILEFYSQSSELTLKTGIQYNVDHIIPLLGEFVSGLHVENNLQVITAEENNIKNNKFVSEWN